MSKEIEALKDNMSKQWKDNSSRCEEGVFVMNNENSNPREALMFIQELLNVSEKEKHFLNLADYNIRLYLIKTKQTLIKSQEYYLKAKAFELIILKNVDVNEIRPNATAEAYNSKTPYYRRPLTDDEFKFLKEMVHRLDCEEILFELPKVY